MAIRVPLRLRRELDVDDVAVAHHVVTALEPQRAAVPRAGEAAGRQERVPPDDLRADEALLDVGVDRAGGVPRGQAVPEVPGLGDGALTGGEERVELQQR